jgi:FKBP-type peptidyl-prolyl cis-trans isomerase
MMNKKLLLSLTMSSLVTVTLLPACKDTPKDATKQETPVVEKVEIKQEDKMTKTINTDSGLKYEIIKESDSAEIAKKGDTVSVHYTGWLEENGKQGKKFDSSVDRGEPFEFALGAGHVIAGWDQGVAGMKVGEKRKLIIPSELGYGRRGAGAVIPPNATLIFDVELLEIK